MRQQTVRIHIYILYVHVAQTLKFCKVELVRHARLHRYFKYLQANESEDGVCMQLGVSTCMYECGWKYVGRHTYEYRYTIYCISTYMYVCMCLRTYVPTYVHVYSIVNISTYIHACTYVYTYIHTWVHANVHNSSTVCMYVDCMYLEGA